MRERPLDVLEKYRVTEGDFASDASLGNNGVFVIPTPWNTVLQLIVSDGEGWEHVSVLVKGEKRLPLWQEMNYVKELFWDEEETVVQFHPRKSQYVNTHPLVLHLWRKVNTEYLLPPKWLVGDWK